MNSEAKFKKLVWRNTIGLSKPMEQATTWSVAGLAALIGLYISHLDSVGQLVTRIGVRWSLLAFTFSLMAGALSKQIGMALTKGAKTAAEIEKTLGSPDGQALMSEMAIQPAQLMQEIAEPFYWPLSEMMTRSNAQALVDPLSGDKRFVRLFCIQLYLVWAHWLFAVCGLVVVAISIVNA